MLIIVHSAKIILLRCQIGNATWLGYSYTNAQ
jgi:hypothetical protein